MQQLSHHRRRRGHRRTRRSRRSAISSTRPLVAFLLIASFGILFAGCGDRKIEDSQEESFTFTADDIATIRSLTQEANGSDDDTQGPTLELAIDDEEGSAPVLDLSLKNTYDSIQSGIENGEEDYYRVTNDFLNVRDAPKVTAVATDRLVRGDVVTLLEFVDAAWAKVKLPGGREGYVAQRYIAKMTSEEKLTKEKEKYAGKYFVDFGFLNVRKAPETTAEKLGELPGQAFVSVISQDDVWARIPFDGGEGYVAVQYLSPFLPNFLIRQDKFTLPILHYRIDAEGILDSLPEHLDTLKQQGLKLIALTELRDVLLQQQERDVRLDPNQVVIAISGLMKDNYTDLTDVLRASSVTATIFIQTDRLGLSGITEKNMLTLAANGHDLQSTAHTGDDLRSLTNAQLELELAQSRKLIEEYTKKPVFAIAYPLGGVNDRVAEKASSAGYLLGVSNAQERQFYRSQLLKLPAFNVTADATGEEVVGLVKGE